MHAPVQFKPRKPTADNVAELLDCLKHRKEPLTAEQIGLLLGWSDRKVRLVASSCDEIISRPGGEGYMLEEKTSEEEFRHCINALFAQARAMIGRAVRLRKRRKSRQLDGGLLPL